MESFSPGGSPEAVGQLPTTRSDLSAVTVAGRVYVLGGYDGNRPLAPVLRTSDGRQLYVDRGPSGSVPLCGGSGGREDDLHLWRGAGKRARLRRDPGNRHAQWTHQDHRTPCPTAFARFRGGTGRSDLCPRRQVTGNPTDEILSFDPSTEKLRRAGHLPFPVTNAAAAGVAGVGYLIGGLDAEGSPLPSVIEVRLVGR